MEWNVRITVSPALFPPALFQFESVFMICFIVSGLECLYVMWPLDDGGSHKTNVSLTRTRKSHHTFIILNCFIWDFRHRIIIAYHHEMFMFVLKQLNIFSDMYSIIMMIITMIIKIITWKIIMIIKSLVHANRLLYLLR